MINSSFEQLVSQNTPWLMKYIYTMVKNMDVTEDILQEVFIRAYKNFDSYIDLGRTKGWLKMIALNCIRRYFNITNKIDVASLDEPMDGSESSPSFVDLLMTNKHIPEDVLLHKEMIRQIMNAIGNLPDIQRKIIIYRYIKEYSINEVAAITSLPAGSIKSKSYYALDKVRSVIKNYVMEGDVIMTCKQAYALLFEYAKGTVTKEDKAALEQHFTTCKECSSIANALTHLVKNLTTALADENIYYMIIIPLASGKSLTYSAFKVLFDDADQLNQVLEKTGGVIPSGETWISAGHDAHYEHIAEFDNEGNKIEFDLERSQNPDITNHIRVIYKKMKKVYPVHWCYSVFLGNEKWTWSTKEAPNLYIGKANNLLGNTAKSAIYLALPPDAKNIRIRKGNGVIDAVTLKFAYVDRYVTEDERLSLECSYLKD